MPKAKKKSASEEFMSLPDAEKERIWESFNRVIPESETTPLTAAEQARWERVTNAAKRREARRKAGRPKIGQGVTRIQLSVEKGLLGKADEYAAQHGMSRAQLVAKGLKLAMAGG
jgi:hypothetical protein